MTVTQFGLSPWLAIPLSFATGFVAGAIIEQTVMRWIYSRSLDAILAAWGLGLIIVQLITITYGRQIQFVETPLSGAISIFGETALIIYSCFSFFIESNCLFFINPKIVKLNAIKIKKIPKKTSFFVFFNKNKAGQVKIEIHTKLKEYVPITERIWRKYKFLEKLKAIKFHGKPVNIDPLIISMVPNIIEKIKNVIDNFFEKKTENKIVISP